MRYYFCGFGLLAVLLFSACAPFGADPIPTPDVAALQTQAVAIRAVNDARATLNAPAATKPPVTATADAVADATTLAIMEESASLMSTAAANSYTRATEFAAEAAATQTADTALYKPTYEALQTKLATLDATATTLALTSTP